ncbi:tail fiber protein [Flavobacterium sp. CHNK8]|nr:tail fiber protein [Flavobacterium sp. CHNK8]
MIGVIKLFAGATAPKGYYTCEGQSLLIESHYKLFSVIGTTYGGDGINTFNIPDLRGAFPTQATNNMSTQALGNYVLGQTGGSNSIVLSNENMPPHTHTIIKGSGSNLTGSISVNTTLKASTSNAITPIPSAINNVLGKTIDTNGNSDPNLYTNAAPNQNLVGINSTVNNTLSFDPTGLQLTPWGTGNEPIPTVPTFVALQFIICFDGFMPEFPNLR